jgi:MFS transporter, ACS family, D-galactonate transporter
LPMAAMSLMIPLAGIISDRLVRRVGDELRVRKTFLAIGLLLGCLIVPAGLTRNPYTAVLLLTLSLGGLGLAAPNTWTLTIAVSPKSLVGTLAGVQNFWGNVGGILAPVVTGYIVHATGSFVLALGFCGAILALGIASYLFMIPDKTAEALETKAWASPVP